MNVSLYQAAAALNANDRWQEIISQNLASSSIPGYKKQDLSFAEVQSGSLSAGSASPLESKSSLPQATAVINFQPGELRSTGSKTDLAIEGPGFFEVQLANGSRAYTRDGEFQINAQGQLTTKQGYLLMGEGGPIQIDLNNPIPMAISLGGDVSQGLDTKGKIKLVDFNNRQLLTALGGGLYQATNPALVENPVTEVKVRQGFVEGANTSPVVEMANLITAMRMYEANQRIIQMQDDRMGKAILELAGTN